MFRTLPMTAGVVMCALTCAGASADTGNQIPFESLDADQPVNQTVEHVSIAAQNDDQAQVTVFNTQARQTAHVHLEGPNGQDARVWATGNLLMDKKLGQVLSAHAEASDHATLSIEFPAPIVSLGMDLINIQNQGDDSSIAFFKQGEQVGEVLFSDLIDPESLFYDPSIAFAPNSANRVQPIYADLLAIDEFDSIVIRLANEQAIDNLTYETANAPVALGFETLLAPNGYNSGFSDSGLQGSGAAPATTEVFALAGGVGGGSGGSSGGGSSAFRTSDDPTDDPKGDDPNDDPTGGPSNLSYPIVPTPSAAMAGLALLGYLGLRRSRQS